MSFYNMLATAWEQNNSMVCVGLDPDITKMPECIQTYKYPIFEFNKAIIDTTYDLVCCYKPQIAYYAGQAAEDQLQMTIDYIKKEYPAVPVILDAKRGDIGATAMMYAKEVFDRYGADAATVNPYMGTDTLEPFTSRVDKGTVILCRTSNPCSGDLQELKANETEIYKHVAKLASEKWNKNRNVLLVIGATYPEELKEVRTICPDIPFLVPGVGAQGGDVKKVLENGADKNNRGLIINSSRGIIYAGNDKDFAQASREATLKLKDSINSCKS